MTTEQHTAQEQAPAGGSEQHDAHTAGSDHAAMCIYCGEAVIYDTRQVTDMAAAHKQLVEHDQQCPNNPLVAKLHALAEQCRLTELQRDDERRRLRSLNEGDSREAWCWMGDGNDHLESLVCPVLIPADDLREIITQRDDWYQAAVGLSGDLTAIGQQRDTLLAFANEAIDAALDGCGLDGAWIQERAEDLGLLAAEACDPERHPDADGTRFEPGDTIYVRQPWMGRGGEDAE